MSLSHEKEKRERREREGSSPIFLSQKKKWSWCWKEFEKWKRKWASFYFFQEILNSLLNHNSTNLKISRRFFFVNKLLITSQSYKSTDDNFLPLNLAVTCDQTRDLTNGHLLSKVKVSSLLMAHVLGKMINTNASWVDSYEGSNLTT